MKWRVRETAGWPADRSSLWTAPLFQHVLDVGQVRRETLVGLWGGKRGIKKRLSVWCHSPDPPSAFILNSCSQRRWQRYSWAGTGTAILTIGSLQTNPGSHMTTGISWLDGHGCSKAWHERDADSYCCKEKENKKKTGTELDLGSEEEIEDVLVTEDERGTRDEVTKKRRLSN